MPRIHILPEPRGRERAGASEAATAQETARAAAAVAAEASVARAAVAEATVAAERSRRCRQRRPHRPRRGSRLLVAVPLACSLGQSTATPELAAETKELLAIPSTQKVWSLLPTSHSRHHVTAADKGRGWRAGKTETVFPRPRPLSIALSSSLRTSLGQGGQGGRKSVVLRVGDSGDW